MNHYYNEHDPRAAAWLRELIRQRLIPDGEVDERSITEVRPSDVAGFRQCHFFAGIGGWCEALRLAEWSAAEPVWTGSCPCQPFSSAGKGLGEADPRHLWPVWARLIAKCRPATCFGEQTGSKAGRRWFTGVRADLEEMGFAVGGADLCAACVGSPHIRQRLFFVAHTQTADRGAGVGGEETGVGPDGERGQRPRSGFATGDMGNADGERRQGDERGPGEREESIAQGSGTGPGSVGDAQGGGCGIVGHEARSGSGRHAEFPGWSRFSIVKCRDGKSRRFEPESFPLAARIPGRLAALRGFGNAIVPQVAAEFIQAYLETRR